MRLSSTAVSILSLALAGYFAVGGIASRAGAAPGTARQSTQQGPMLPGARGPVQATQQQQPPQLQQPLQVQTAIVNVFATVRDKHKAILSNMTKDDFKIYEDGVEQKIAYFKKEADLPITLALLIDTSGSMANILGAEQDAASRFVQQVMRKKDEGIVISFDTDVNLLADFTEDTSVLERAIRRAEINAAGPVITPGTIPQKGGGTNLYDAVYLACHDELATEAGRKAVILLTDAEDTGSQMSEQDAIEAAQRADAVIHVLLITDYSATEGYGPGVASKMAGDTGGRVINVHNQKTLNKAFDAISEELRSQYALGYYPTNTKRDGTFRKIKVEVSRGDTRVLARKGYYAPLR
ncbi:MAG TPA: VWA domain-containing protein [Candidatus Polarisedimenticolia bacterium]|nr:VWA domain-containing protein [Candidatus Polarisedimenticolia bacterium]